MNHDTPLHQETWALLPWLAKGLASPQQARQAEAHLKTCPDCQAELARERRLAQAMALPPAHGPDVERGLQHLMQRLDQADDTRPARPARGAWSIAGARIGVSTAALLGLAELILVSAGLVWWLRTPSPASQPPAAYQTLTQRAAAPPGPALRVVFQGKQPIGEVQALLVAQGLVIFSGPTEAGVFTLGLAPGPSASERPDLDAVAARLRQSSAVLFAETTASTRPQ